MEHLEVVEDPRQVKLETKVAVLMEGMELPLLGYQHKEVEQVQTAVQDILAVAAVVVLLVLMVLVAVVDLVVVMVAEVVVVLMLRTALLILDLVVEEIPKEKLPVMEERVLLSP